MAVSWRTSLEKGLRNRNEYVRLFLAEFLGSFVLVVGGKNTCQLMEFSAQFSWCNI